jgi:hypothetical protein
MLWCDQGVNIHRIVSLSKYDDFYISLASDSPQHFKTGKYGLPDLLETSWLMEIAEARALKPYVRVRFTVHLADSRVYRDSQVLEPKLEDPTEIRSNILYLLVKLDHAEVVDSRNGAVFKKLANS